MSTAAGLGFRIGAVRGFGAEFEPILAEEHPIADEKGGRTEHAAADRLVGVGLQLLLHGGIGNECQHAIDVESALSQYRGDFVLLVEVAVGFPDCPEYQLHVAQKLPRHAHLHRYRATQHRQRVDRKMRSRIEGHAIMLAPQFQVAEHPSPLGSDRHGTDVAGRLEDGSQQNRPPDYFWRFARRGFSATGYTRGSSSRWRNRTRI